MRSAAFLARQWPRVREYLVEECVAARRVLHVNDVLPQLTGWHRAIISKWNPPTHPQLTLVPRMGGPFRRWWFVCPRCGDRRDALYSLPGGSPTDWRCRACHGLIYASQRHGPRHPLSRVLTRRKRAGRQKTVWRQERLRARQVANQSRWLSPGASADLDEEAIAMATVLRAVLAERAEERQAVVAKTLVKIAAEAERSEAVLQELAQSAKSKKVSATARRGLARRGVTRRG